MNEHTISTVWPDWIVVRQLGRGSFGSVYEAVRTEFGIESHTAIKIIDIPQNQSEVQSLRADGLSEEAIKTYFQNVVKECIDEIRLMESLKGTQNIVSIEDYKFVENENEIGGQIYIRMELLTPFNEYVKTHKLSQRDVVKLGIDICTALEFCQKTNIIHRDIKPENIFIHRFGDFKLGDFGIARKLESSTVALSKKFTYNYMAPEVQYSPVYDATVDQYSLGLVLYKLLNQNRLPFIQSERQMTDPTEKVIALNRRMRGEAFPPPCQASPLLADIIMEACSFDPKKRFRTPTAMKNALTYVLNSLPAEDDPSVISGNTKEVRPPVPSSNSTIAVQPPIEKWNTPHEPDPGEKKDLRSIILIGAVAVVIGIALLVYLTVFRKKDEPVTDSSSVAASSETEESAAASEQTVSVSELAEEEPVTWEDAYIEYFNTSLDNGDEISGFMLFDADKDQIPELLLWYAEHSAVGLISWYDDTLQENALGEYCSTVDSMSGITYYPKDQVLYSRYISPSKTDTPVYSILNKGRLERVEKVTSQKNAINYVLADAYQPTVKNFEKKVHAWSPETAFTGRKPIVNTKTPTPTPTMTPTPEPAPPAPVLTPELTNSVKLPLCDVYAPASDFVFPDSSERYLTEEEVDAYVRSMAGDDPELIACYSQLIISEIEARYGYVFPTERVAGRFARDYFSGLDWYETAKQYCPVGQGQGEALVQGYCNEYERYNIYKVVAPWQAKNNNNFNG